MRTILILMCLCPILPACSGGRAEEERGAKVESKHTNRLAKESSPYLLQHAHNPVDWYPWGAEAFEKAKKEDKPVFLSIGYATCHWCHVMERESFEDEAVAALLNEHFVAIKVDREERPDVDNVYMAAVQAMTGSGGWPLSVFLTPDGKPFYGGTYFPPEDRYGRPGFTTLLKSVLDAWKNKREELLGGAEKLTSHLRTLAAVRGEAKIGEETLEKGFRQYSEKFDARHGGFETAPKFPRTHGLSFLLRVHDRTRDPRALTLVSETLLHMWRGGVYDHVAGGFHRYSTDREWLVPHFEKMLYDQALVVRALVETFQVTGNERFEWIARDVLTYVLRDMTDAGGAFYSAEDADAEGVEGKFHVWSFDELLAVLGPEDGRFFADVFGASPAGNFREESTGEPTGLNILHLDEPLPEVAKRLGTDVPSLEERIALLKAKLLAVREHRVHPLKDDKILTDWNGLMIASLAYAGRALDDPAYLAAAAKAADFLLGNMLDEGRLLHRYRGGDSSIPGFLDDYAFLSYGLLELYEATFEPRRLAEAKRLAGEMVRLFLDRDNGGFYFTARDGEALVSRTKELYDGAIPSGNSVATLVLARLGRLTADPEMEKTARDCLKTFSAQIDQFPMGYPFMLMALDFDVGPTREIVLAGEAGEPGLDALKRTVHSRFLPRSTLAFHPAGEGASEIRGLAPYIAAQTPVDGKAAAYVCEGYACKEPVTTPEDLEKLLRLAAVTPR